MAQRPYYLKDPQAVLDYGFDWSRWLEGADFVTESSWTIPDGLTMETEWFDGLTTAVRLSGGTVGVVYTVTNHIKTDAQREDDRSMTLRCTQR